MITKTIYMTWKTPEIMASELPIVKHGLRQMIDLNPGWTLSMNYDSAVNSDLEFHLSRHLWEMIKDDHIVTKIDLWRLIMLYEHGGVYCDVDRICDTPLDDIIGEGVSWVLPTCLDHDFSHDFMATAPGNPAMKLAADLYLARRSQGQRSTYLLGPQTYMHAVTETLTSHPIDSGCGPWIMGKLREHIATMPFIATYREQPPYKTILHRGDVDFDHEKEKRRLYAECGMQHWTGEW